MEFYFLSLVFFVQMLFDNNFQRKDQQIVQLSFKINHKHFYILPFIKLPNII